MLSLPKVAVVLIVLTPASGFTAGNNYSNGRTSTALNIFRKAFANDDSLGKAENPGLKKGPDVSEVTINGTPVKAVAGQKVSQVLAAAKVKVTYSCRKGDCGTCELFMNGRIEKACNAKIPQGKCVITTN